MFSTSLGELTIRETSDDSDLTHIWETMLQPRFKAGDSFCVPTDIGKEDALAFWAASSNRVFLAEVAADGSGKGVGTYWIAPSQQAGGSHVASCSFITAPNCEHKGVGRAMLDHALQTAAGEEYRSMQLSFVVSTSKCAISLFLSGGFQEIGKLPAAFEHPKLGYVDVCIFYKTLGVEDLAGWFKSQKSASKAATNDAKIAYFAEDEAMQEEIVRLREARDKGRRQEAGKGGQGLTRTCEKIRSCNVLYVGHT